MTGPKSKSKPIAIPSWEAYEPWATKDQLLWLQALLKGDEKVIHAELLKCSKNPWHFLRAWIQTENAHSTSRSTFERFPDDPHLYYLCMLWVIFRRLCIPKSRQMTVTWLISALYLWAALFHPSSLIFFQSKKEEDADQNLERAWTMYQRLPEFFRKWQPASRTFCHVRFKRNRSHIWAIPQGADHARQYTATGYFSDETAFQEGVENVMGAVGPTLKEKGRFTAVSSAAPSYFEMLCFDKTL